MPSNPSLQLYSRKTLDLITKVPKDIISVYVVEQHIWSNKGTKEEREVARKNRVAESQTVQEFLIEPVRPFLMEIFRLLSAPYNPNQRDQSIGQGYWIQAEFGSGKSHLLSFIGALALGGEKEWNIIKEKEEKAGRGKRESLHYYQEGLARKNLETKGVLVAVKTLVGQGDSNTGLTGSGKTLADYVLDAVGDAYFAENGHSLPLYPTEILAERFVKQDLERYSSDLERYLKDPRNFDEEKRVSLDVFLNNLQDHTNPKIQQDCGQILWDFYRDYLKVTPDIPLDSEPKLDHMMERLLAEGYAGLLLILDEVSLYMKGRSEAQKAEDEKVLVVLSNRLAKVNNRPIWTICSAQQAIESQGGVRNIIADDRLKLIALLNKEESYYDIALSRVREITDPNALDQYYEDYKRSFSWPQNDGKDKFNRFFPFYPPAIDVVRAVSYKLTTIRSALSFMLETIKAMRIKKSDELITHWSLFDDVVNYTEDPSGTNRSITAIKTKFTNDWKAYEEACKQINQSTNPLIKTYRSRCEKIVKTLFLYHIANLLPEGLTSEEIMNSVMEWKDHDTDRRADLQDNKDHYENLVDKLDLELTQIEKIGRKFRFNPQGTIDVFEIFQRARVEAEQNSNKRRDAWHQLLSLDGWLIPSNYMTIDLARGIRSVFHEIAPESSKDITVTWHNREITGRIFMKDLMDIAHHNRLVPNINSPETGLDFSVFVSSTHIGKEIEQLLQNQKDPRVLYWSPDQLTPAETSQLIDFTAYRIMAADYSNRDTADSKTIMDWIQGRLGAEMGSIYRIVTESYSRGHISALDHSELGFNVSGELTAILAPLAAQVLNSVYKCGDMNFRFNAPFNDLNAVNVINGIVRMGEFPRGIKPSKEVSASQNFGFDLGIMIHPNDKKLDLRQCQYTSAILAWIDEKSHSGGTTVGADTVYKNFMGINGANGVSYGLSKRMVQMYLLCLAREGRIRISLTGRNQPVEAVDYTNIASIDFKVATLDAFDQVQLLKAPEGWDILAPFAAILLEDDTIRNVREDAEIQQAVLRLLEWKSHNLESCRSLNAGLNAIFSEFELINPHESRLKSWEIFLTIPVEASDSIADWRKGLEKAFSYPVFHDEEVRQVDLDDLALRCNEINQFRHFYAHESAFRSSMRYLQTNLPDDEIYGESRWTIETCKSKTKHLAAWMTSEALLMSEFLTPMNAVIESYRVRYLQLFDKVVSHTEKTRQSIRDLESSPEFIALSMLGGLPALGADLSPDLREMVRKSSSGGDLFPASLTRGLVEHDLSTTPRPASCPLTLENAMDWIRKADEVFAACKNAANNSLQDKSRLLLSPALKQRLNQGKYDPFIAAILKTETAKELIEFLVTRLNQPNTSDCIQTLERYLKRITVVKVKLSDFHPAKHTLEKGDIESITRDFGQFISQYFIDHVSDDQVTIVEIE